MKAYIAVVQPFPPAGDGYFVTTVVFEDIVDRLDEFNSAVYLGRLGERYPPGLIIKIESRPDRLGGLAEKARAGGRYADAVVLLERQLPGAELCVLAARLLRIQSRANVGRAVSNFLRPFLYPMD